jgi:imidazolonepropionase-like amidohydrolase
VEVGKRADLVVLEDAPLQDISAVRNIRWTIRNGIAHTPKAWMNKE